MEGGSFGFAGYNAAAVAAVADWWKAMPRSARQAQWPHRRSSRVGPAARKDHHRRLTMSQFSLVALVSITLLFPRGGRGGDIQCKDPLFETHWFGKSDIETLNNFPTVMTKLRLCPVYNRKASCCNPEFEKEQIKYFHYFKDKIFTSILARIVLQQESVNDVMHTPEYAVATRTEVEQYQAAVQAFNPVLSPKIHADCFAAIVTYVAGMVCFSCRPDWFQYVQLHNDLVTRVRIRSSVCVELWSRCEPFGFAAMTLKQRNLDSSLSKQAKKANVNLDMFKDQQALCEWLHDRAALHPFTLPTEAEKEAAPAAQELLKAFTNFSLPPDLADPEAEAPEARRMLVKMEYDAMTEGKNSGFPLNWHGLTAGAESWQGGVTLFRLLMCLLSGLHIGTSWFHRA